jgi:apolipoprotein N-acyltransferase
MSPDELQLKPLRWQDLALAATSGVLLAMAFPGVDQAWLAWIALVPLALVAFHPRRKRSMAMLFSAFGAGFYLVLLYWFMAMHPLTWLGFSEAASLAIVLSAWLGFSFLLVLQLAGFGFVYGWMSQGWGRAGWKHVLALALGWTTLEWLTSLGMFGFTWGNLALTQYKTLPMLQVLDLVGPFPLAAVIVGFNGALALAIRRQVGRPFALANWKPVGVAVVPVALVAGYGAIRLGDKLPDTTFSVEIVQGNIHGGEKFSKGPGALDRTLDKYLSLSSREKKTDLVIWPETAVPTYFRNQPALYQRVQETARAENRYYMVGTLDWTGNPPTDFQVYNAVGALGPRGESLGFDYKRHLVPFGEYVPFRNSLPEPFKGMVGQINILAIDFSPGIDPHLFEFPFAKIGAGVCYDGIFPDAVRPTVAKGAEVVALVTNDAWYKDTTAPRVLNAHAVLRAVENKRWILRAANTGISSVIDPVGNIQGATPVYQDATLVGRAAPMKELTLYTRFGDWASGLAGLGFVALMLDRWKNRRRKAAEAV